MQRRTIGLVACLLGLTLAGPAAADDKDWHKEFWKRQREQQRRLEREWERQQERAREEQERRWERAREEEERRQEHLRKLWKRQREFERKQQKWFEEQQREQWKRGLPPQTWPGPQHPTYPAQPWAAPQGAYPPGSFAPPVVVPPAPARNNATGFRFYGALTLPGGGRVQFGAGPHADWLPPPHHYDYD